ncbi:protein-L-isoaspartate(D-aspartate) O-methyltransferase [Pseudonocardia hierapolitana]|uniref:Protein-L-isoaspartate O-methyltransferase n=1 Tax=Pseudonocardia hierapolitana TaxID=1128676 RepID=A0A561SLE5_9PSEU|nr:protein-L-isoaspartate(D-aspartate) O-methyltransferase [Pseudonocardia hierapolitana]
MVDRADFVDGFYVRGDGGWSWVAADVRPPPPEVAELIYSDSALVTAVGAGGVPRSSSSQPSLVVRMLDRLQLRVGGRVLEIGTGTGYNAALLSRIVGETGRVTTVDVDPDLVAAAAARIGTAAGEPGFGPVEVICGDGAAGWPGGAPYDRMIATVGCGAVPEEWWDQLRDDGLAVVPLSHGSAFPIVGLRRGERRGEWSGRYLGHAGFMVAVGDGLRRRESFELVRVPEDVPVLQEALDAEPSRCADLAFFLCLEVPGVRLLGLSGGSLGPRVVGGPGWRSADGDGATVLSGTSVQSVADPDGLRRVREATERWVEVGRPGLERYRLGWGGTLADPPEGAIRSWTTTRGSAVQTVHLVTSVVDDDGSSSGERGRVDLPRNRG